MYLINILLHIVQFYDSDASSGDLNNVFVASQFKQ